MRRGLLLGALLVAFLIGSLARKPTEHVVLLAHNAADRQRAEREPPESVTDLAETFPYDVAARFNEGVVANIDAIDTALTTILAGNVAILVLTIDRIKELAPTEAHERADLWYTDHMRYKVAGGHGFSDLFKEYARRIAEADGVVPLKPGELRPDGYYMAGFWSRGRKPIDMSKPAPPPRDKR